MRNRTDGVEHPPLLSNLEIMKVRAEQRAREEEAAKAQRMAEYEEYERMKRLKLKEFEEERKREVERCPQLRCW